MQERAFKSLRRRGPSAYPPDHVRYRLSFLFVVVYHVTIVAIGHGLVEEILAYGDRLRSTHCRESH